MEVLLAIENNNEKIEIVKITKHHRFLSYVISFLSKNRKVAAYYFNCIVALYVCSLLMSCAATTKEESSEDLLKFKKGDSAAYTFNTGVLSGVLRQSGKSIGLVPVTYIPDGSGIAAGEGLFNHYRVFTKGLRYGYGARRWPSTAKLQDDGSVEVVWPTTPDRPFELSATYKWVSPNTIDLITAVRATENLKAYEVFLASYYSHAFTDSRVWASHDPRGGDTKGFVSADRELGEWLAFPRDNAAKQVITDGRWDLEPHPLEWTLMPDFDKPLAIRRDPGTGTTVIVMTKRADCFGIFTPYGEEKHISNYLSVFGNDIENGETVKAHSRLVVLSKPTDKEILNVANAFLQE